MTAGGAAARVEAWRARLASSRAALMRALEGVTEREFAADFADGRSLVHVLASLAVDERAAVARVTNAAHNARVAEKPLAPQAIHDLAGARYQTTRLIAEQADIDEDAMIDLTPIVEAIATREESIAAQIAARRAAPEAQRQPD